MKAILRVIVTGLLLPVAAIAQTSTTAPTEISSVSFVASNNPMAASQASFAIGMTADNGSTFITTTTINDSIRIIGKVRPEAGHVGSNGDLYVVDQVNGAWTMQTTDGSWVPWNFIVPSLVPAVLQVTLKPDTQFDVFVGKLSAGEHKIYIGYKAKSGNLHYTPLSRRLTVTQPTATEQAYSQFVSAISPNIIQSRCILCHVKGGAAEAGGALHIFKEPLGSNLAANFATFQDLVSKRGVTYILTKVTGGNNHGGSVQLTASSQDYKALQTFLELVKQDVTDQSQTGSTTNTNPYDPYASPY